MRIIALDFESYFADDYELKKMTTESYVRDLRFEAHGAAIKWGADHAARWYSADQLRQINAEDWSDMAIVCHHAQFDGLILSHHYGVRPKLWLDTLAMARLLLGNHLSVSLDSVRAHYGIPVKRTPYERFKGKHWSELDHETQELVAHGCEDEVESIWTIFGRLAENFPREEYALVDLTVRMFTEPVLRADVELLGKIWSEENVRKSQRLVELGVSADELQSSDKFRDLLNDCGVEVAYKQGKNGLIPAFARTDDFMRGLLEDEDDRIRGLAEARLGIKCTLQQTRAETLGYMAQRGALCVYLRYAGAHTTRWSGGDSSNFQNFKRGSDLRKAILAPEGYLLATVDLAQIECRILNYLAGQSDVIDNFRNGHDPYVGIATAFYGRPITKADASERGTGKQAELSCGFGCGWKKFQRTAALGIYGPPVRLTDEDSQRAVGLYRDSHRQVVALWRAAESWLKAMSRGQTGEWGPMYISGTRIGLPNGAALIYDTLEWVEDETGGFWRIKLRSGYTKLYGAKLVENVVQALARVVMSEACARIAAAGFRPVLSSHDEWSFLVADDARKSEALDFILQEMKRTPDWLPGIPLDAELIVGDRYAK